MDKVNEFEYGADTHYSNDVNTNYVKFSVDSNLHYRFSSAEDLLNDLDTLAAMIKHHHEYQVKRLSVLDDYYKARNTNIMDNRRRREKEKADHRSAHNFGKVLCTFDVGYNTGNPIKVQIEDTNQQKEIEEFNTNNDIDGLNAELWLDMDKYGRAYEIIYRDSDDTDYVDLANVFETFVVYDTTVKREPILAVRYPKTRFNKDADKQYIQAVATNLASGDIETLIDVLRIANSTENPRVSEKALAEYVEENGADDLFDEVFDELKKSAFTSKKVTKILEQMEA